MSSLVGKFVECKNNNRGIAKVIGQSSGICTIEYFKSIGSRDTIIVQRSELKRVIPYKQTRCYYFDEARQRWRIGRIKRNFDDEFEVDFPDCFSIYLKESELFVRCNEPIEDPSEVLKLRGHETTFFNHRRTQFVKTLMNERNVSRGMDGLLSSNILLLPHQVEVVRRVLEDPIQRYLLADEVGLGKTIEAGVIVRQYLLDHPEEFVLFIVPPFLLKQWKSEMIQRFSLDHFAERIAFLTINDIERIDEINVHFNMVVIDEAHEVASLVFSNNARDVHSYQVIKRRAHDAKGLLLLSATPVLNNEAEFLSMLHLLDPAHYKLEDLDDFKSRVEKRQEIGRFLLSFNEESRTFMLRRTIKRFAEFFPEDELLLVLLDRLERLIELDHHDESKRKEYIRDIRVHISETYRLHRRLLRNRRDHAEDMLPYGRSSANVVKEEYDLDDVTSSAFVKLFDEWRNGAWASEYEIWEQEGTQITNRYRLFLLLFEVIGSSERLMVSVLRSRLNLQVEPLTESELSQEQLDLLIHTPHFEEEPVILRQMINLLEELSEDGDRIELVSMLIEMMKNRSEQKQNPTPKIVIFTNFSVVAEEIVTYLRSIFGDDAVSSYNRLLDKESLELEVQRFEECEDCFLLICDSSGEVGRNLQFADAMIHFDLPLSPNRIEQRIGRLDRIGRNKPYVTYSLCGPEHEDSLYYSWYEFLTDGLQVFNTSISSLQFFIDDRMQSLMRKVYIKGKMGFTEMMDSIEQQLKEEKVKISEQQTLDEIDAFTHESRTFYDAIVQYEEQFSNIQEGIEPWICEALQMSKVSTKFTFHFKPIPKTLIPLNFLQPINDSLDKPGCYDREEVITHKSCNLFRIGNPFIDVLRQYIDWDDRGQTFALWRVSKHLNENDSEVLSFIVNYTIEGDVRYAMEVVKAYNQTAVNEKSLQRKLDHYFPPLFQTEYVDIQGNKIVDQHFVEELTKPFQKRKSGGQDYNMTKENLIVIDEFISEQYWAETVKSVCAQATASLVDHPDFIELCHNRAAAYQVKSDYLYSQMKLREQKQATFDLDFEKSLQDALKKGIEKPKIRLDSIGFVVLSGKEMRVRNGRFSNTEGISV